MAFCTGGQTIGRVVCLKKIANGKLMQRFISVMMCPNETAYHTRR